MEAAKAQAPGNIFVLLYRRIRRWFRRNSLHLLLIVCLIAMAFLVLFDRIFITVEAGERGVLFETFGDGTVTDRIYGEGLHMIAPWNTMYKYNTRQQVVTKDIHVLSTDGLSIDIDLAVRYFPRMDSLGIIHTKLGPQYPYTVVIPEVESSIRKIISQFDPHDFYTIRRDSIERLVLEDTRVEFGELNIIIHDIMIEDIVLPQELEMVIEEKLIEEQEFLKYEHILNREKQEEMRKLIEARGIRTFEDSSGISMLKWKGLDVTQEIAKSSNAKVVIVGTGAADIPVILGGAD